MVYSSSGLFFLPFIQEERPEGIRKQINMFVVHKIVNERSFDSIKYPKIHKKVQFKK